MSHGQYRSDMASGYYPAMSYGDWANAPFNEVDEDDCYIGVNAYFEVGVYDRETDTEYEVDEDVYFDNLIDYDDERELSSQVFDKVNEFCKNKYRGKDWDFFNLIYERA